MAGGPKRSREFVKSLLAIMLGLAIALLAAEGFVRVVFDEPVQPRFVIDSGYGVRWNKANVDTRHYVPGDYDVRITTNSVGMRGQREYPVERVPGRRRIVMLGDSFVFGYGVEDNEVVSAVLEDLLNASAPTGTGYEVINLAVSGFGQAEELVTWLARGKQYRPDAVVLFYFENDIGNNAVSELYALDSEGVPKRTGRAFLPGTNLQDALQGFPGLGWLFEHSEAWNLIRNRLSAIVQRRLLRSQGLGAYDEAAAGASALTSSLLRQMVSEVQSTGAQVVMVNIPSRRLDRSNFPMTVGQVAEIGAEYLDGRDYLVSADYYDRDSHWRPSGHRKTADRLLQLLESKE